MSKPSNLKTDQTCRRCNASMAKGSRAVWYNFPRPGGWYHVDACPNGQTPERTAPEPSPARTPAAPGSLDAIVDARIEQALGGFQPDAALDEEAVRRIVAESQGATVKVEIKRLDETTHTKEGAHFMFARVAKLVGAGVHVQLWGPAGTGKTTLAMEVADALGLGWELDTLDPTTPKSALMGYRTPTGEPVHTSLTRAARDGMALILDENDLAPGGVQSLLGSALANGHVPTAWGRQQKAPGFSHLGCSNTPLAGPTPTFKDRREGSSSYRDRLFYIYIPQDLNIEARAAGLPLDPVPAREETTCTPAEWVLWVRAMRVWASSNAPVMLQFLGQRASLTGIKLLALGETPRELADGLVFKGADEAMIGKALAACPLPSRPAVAAVAAVAA